MNAPRRLAPAPSRATQWLLLLSLCLPLLHACSDQAPAAGDGAGGGANNPQTPQCVDFDGDGFGTNCPRGDDINDSNPAVHEADCAQGNFAGCPCQEGTQESCFEGVAGQEGVGLCRGGQRTCEDGQWTPCIGQILAQEDVCDQRDNDCDGQTDEELPIGPCGTCDELCSGGAVGDGQQLDWGLTEDNSEGLRVNDQNGLELQSDQSSFDFLWIANSEEGTVSKVDTNTGREVGRYVSALKLDLTMPNPLERCPPDDNQPRGNCPSRTAVDLRGDVWVANRAFFSQGSVSKIAHRDCVDRNGDGTIQTSSDVNGNGVIDLNNNQEFFGDQDECILFTVKIGGFQSIPRALAIDPFAPVRGVGSVWVGAWNERRYYQLDASNGNLLQTVNVPHNPYGAVMDRFGTLWSMDLGSSNAQTGEPEGLVRITSATGQAQGPIRVRSTSGCAGGYGITVDGADNVWIGGFGCEAVYRYTPSTDSWFTVRMPANTGWTRGIAADRDGWIYVGSSNLLNNNQTSVGHITRFRQEDGSQLRVFDYTNRSRGTIGVGLDNQGRVWGVNGDSSNATRLDPSTGQTEHFPVGTGPYTYSDFTGYTLRNFTAPQGTYRSLFRGCPDKDRAMWRDISWEGDEPVGTDISVRVKSAYTLDELVTAPYYGPYSDNPTDLDAAQVPDGKFLEVEVTMTTDTPGVSPILWNLSVTWNCPPIL